MSISAIPAPIAHTQLGDAGRNNKASDAEGRAEFSVLSSTDNKALDKSTLQAQEQKTDSHHDKAADDRIKQRQVKVKLDGTREEIKLLDNGTKMRTPIDDKKDPFKTAVAGEGVSKSGTGEAALTKAIFDVSA